MIDSTSLSPITLSPDGLNAMRDAFLAHCRDFRDFATPAGIYSTEERLYKDELVEVFRATITPALFEGLPSPDAARGVVAATRVVLTKPLQHSENKPQNLMGWRPFWFLRKMTDHESVAFAEALRDLLYGHDDSSERLGQFNDMAYPIAVRHQNAMPSWTVGFPTFWLMLHDPTNDIFVRKTSFTSAVKHLVGRDPFTKRLFDTTQYRYIQRVSRALFDALSNWGWKPRDMIDVQSFIWVATSDSVTPPPDPLPPPPPPNGDPVTNPFTRLLDSLAAANLTFSPEVVSNYLLAIQSKRFVLLTGISGTGKTQLAMEVAKHFRPSVDEVQSIDNPLGAVEVTVRPDMIKRTRITLPATLRDNVRLPSPDPNTNRRQIRVHFPGGAQDQTYWYDPGRNVIIILFGKRSDVWRWFQSTFSEGDRFLLSIEPDEGDDPFDSVRIAVPRQQTVRRPLDNYAVIAVQPDWTDHRGLLGFFNPITTQYVSTPFLDLLLRASADVTAAATAKRDPYPFFAILDEMNLARVEHYFADFLSCLESEEALVLHEDAATETGEDIAGPAIPRKLKIPPNVFFTGTVNIDETTYMFSPKVLDRAFTIELNEVDLGALGGAAQALSAAALRLDRLPPTLVQPTRSSAADWRSLGELSEGDLRARVVDIHDLLAGSNRHFGYRVANEIARYVTLAAEQAGGSEEVLRAALDLALLQKVLPKFHGTQAEIEDVLFDLLALAVDPSVARDSSSRNASRVDRLAWKVDRGRLVPATVESRAGPEAPDPDLPRMAAKLWRMLDRLHRQGFTSFIE